MLIKRAELQIDSVRETQDILGISELSSRLADDSDFLSEFRKTAAELKKIAPKAKDFLYFSAVMMHAAEAALLDEQGNIRKDAHGNDLTARWEVKGDSWKWLCSDPIIRPYKNNNGDIFPESQLIEAHKKWVGKPLCLDHKSSSVDFVRGLVVDTVYDPKHKRIIALCALDKLNHPDLARKVETGQAIAVSMGTGVNCAICTDCGRPARVEADFCDHMKHKSCYGEINIGLNPLELSIVMNGADQKAKIRHIVAAANSMAQYIEMKQAQIQKLSEDETKDIELASEMLKSLEEIEKQISATKEKLQQLKSNEEAEQAHYEQKAAASESDLTVKQAEDSTKMLLDRIEQLDSKINKLFSEDYKMASTKQGYWQGGGGPNEPTPGKPKYEKEDSEKIRNTEDKQMSVPVTNDDPSKLFPGDEEKKRELQRLAERREQALKQAQEILAAKKEAAKKEGYWLGGGGANEPTPGKPKYTKEDSDSTRDGDDKQMVGAPPFPGVGKVDSAYPGDLEEKKKWCRASLKAKFINAAKTDGTHDLGESRWQVYADDKLVLTVKVADVARVAGARSETMYSAIATKEFGKDLIAQIKNEGFDKVAGLYSVAQVAPSEMPPPAPTPPNLMAGGPTSPGLDAPMGNLGDMTGPAPTSGTSGDLPDMSKSGDPKEVMAELIKDLQNDAKDLAEAYSALSNEEPNELDDPEKLAGDQVLTTGAQMRKKLSQDLREGIKQTLAHFKTLADEVELAQTSLSRPNAENDVALMTLVNSTIEDVQKALAESWNTRMAVVKYAKGTQNLVKRAQKLLNKEAQLLPGIGEESPQVEKSLQSLPGHDKRVNPASGKSETLKGDKWFADGTNMYWDGEKYVSVSAPAKKPAVPAGSAAPPAGMAYAPPASGEVNLGVMSPQDRGKALQMGDLKARQPGASHKGVADVDTASKAPMVGKPSNLSVSPHAGEAGAKADDGMADDVTLTKGDVKMEMSPDDAMKMMKGAETQEDRAARRAKLAEKALKYQEELKKAHPGGGFTTQLDNKPSDDLAKVETLEEQHARMEEVAKAAPAVKKAAEDIQKYVLAGKIDPKDIDFLVSQGLDSAAASYWKKYYGQAPDGGSEFASNMIKDYVSKKAEEEKEVLKVKVARAFELAYEMAERGLCDNNPTAIKVQADDIANWSDDNFDRVKKMVARSPLTKKAMAQVGLMHESGVVVPAPETESNDLRTALNGLFAHRTYRGTF